MNYSQIVLNDPDLYEYFNKNAASRKVLLRSMLIELQNNGYVSNTVVDEYNDQLADLINIVAIYWIPESTIYHQNSTEQEIIHHHLNLLFMPFRGYLTKKGQKNLSLALAGKPS